MNYQVKREGHAILTTDDIVKYDDDYFDKYVKYDKNPYGYSYKLSKARREFVARHYKGFLLDVGVGSGHFVAHRPMTMGFDINPKAVEWLKSRGEYSDKFEQFYALSFWDVLEHEFELEMMLDRIRDGAYLFTSIPVFFSVEEGVVKRSKHFRPGEHFHYWTKEGFISFMDYQGFSLLDVDDFETDIGREDILSFAFCRD